MLYPKDRLVKVTKGEELIIEWRKPPIDGIVFSVFGLLPFILIPVVALTPDKEGMQRTVGEMIGFSGFLGPIGLVFLYVGLSMALNKTTIVATRTSVKRHIGPLFVRKDLSIEASHLKQFFVSRYQSSTQSNTVYAPSIYVMDDEQHVQMFAAGLPSPFASYQVQHELQDFYGLEDLPVYGVTTDPAHPGPR